MWLRITGPFAELELRVCVGPRVGARVFNEDDALALLRPAFGPGLDHSRLRALLDAAGLRTATLDDHELLAQTARLITRGELDVIVHPRIPSISEPIERVELRPQATASDPAPLEAADHWIELAVQTADGTALSGIRCEITLPWGTMLTRTTDRLGLIRLEGLPATGDCKLRFITEEQDDEEEPVTEPEEWELLETYVEHELQP
jgi:hypothetical protein